MSSGNVVHRQFHRGPWTSTGAPAGIGIWHAVHQLLNTAETRKTHHKKIQILYIYIYILYIYIYKDIKRIKKEEQKCHRTETTIEIKDSTRETMWHDVSITWRFFSVADIPSQGDWRKCQCATSNWNSSNPHGKDSRARVRERMC